ncbi:unnamed protein product, partial [Thelazia callipaeda]|uniref:WIYLD domain-containing protein n=1 Tax=Thelazia callipaeda TaxID=103827 RepID=A0A0N5CR92_THECL
CRGRITTALDDTDVHVVNVHNHQPNAEIVPKRRVRTMLRKLAERGEMPQSEILKKIQDMEVAFGRSREQENAKGYAAERRYISRHMKLKSQSTGSESSSPKMPKYSNYAIRSMGNKEANVNENELNNKVSKDSDSKLEQGATKSDVNVPSKSGGEIPDKMNVFAQIDSNANNHEVSLEDKKALQEESEKKLMKILLRIECSDDEVDSLMTENNGNTADSRQISSSASKKHEHSASNSKQFGTGCTKNESPMSHVDKCALRGLITDEIADIMYKRLWPDGFTHITKLEFMRDVIDKILDS